MTASFAADTALDATGEGRWDTRLSSAWSIGENSNGGYLLTPALRAAHEISGHPDLLTVTTHFFRPGQGDQPAEVTAEVMKLGRTMTTVRAELAQDGKARVALMAGFGDLNAESRHEFAWAPTMPDIAAPDDCADPFDAIDGLISTLEQSCDLRIDAERLAASKAAGRAELFGWLRFANGADPDALALPFFADAFVPSVFAATGPTGWVPSLELTVQVRQRPAPGWIAIHAEAEDMGNGKLIETAKLWDSTGVLVAHSRQLMLLL